MLLLGAEGNAPQSSAGRKPNNLERTAGNDLI